MNLLLLSNSTNYGEEYLDYAKPAIQNFLGPVHDDIIFIPYAAVTIDWDDYTDMVNDALKEMEIKVMGIHTADDPVGAVKKASSIMVGGGNSWQLLSLLYQFEILKPIRQKVKEGTPYIGWSAGSNMACPTLMTTNDMPVVQPPSFRSLDLIPFQINPHYTEEVIPNHGGESRELRIREFIEVNREMKVIGLPEGMIIQYAEEKYELIGTKCCKLFQYGRDALWINDNEALNRFILD